MSLIDTPRINKLKFFVDQTKHLDGMHAEVGVYKGGSAQVIAHANPDKHLFLFDTFEGMPKPTDHDLHKEKDFADTSVESVQEFLKNYNNISFHKGLFQNTWPVIDNMLFSFVHIDCDLYESVKHCIEVFCSRMVPGGIMVFDDYLAPDCPGAKKAVDERYNMPRIISLCQCQVAIRF